jgi:hypothetical protein
MNTLATEQVQIGAKPAWLSRTVGINLLAALLLLADAATKLDIAFVRSEWFLAGLAIANVILRFLTVRPARLLGDVVAVAKLP